MLVAGAFITEMYADGLDLEGTMLAVTGRGMPPFKGIDVGDPPPIDLVAGTLIAEMYADGFHLEGTMLAVTGRGMPPFKGIEVGDLLPIDPHDFVRKGALLVARLLAKLMSVSAVDVAMGPADGLPLGLYTGVGSERYLRDALRQLGRTDSFSELPEPCITVTDLDRNDEQAGTNNPAPIAPCAAGWGCPPDRAVCGVRGALCSGRRVDPPRPQDDP